MYIVWYLEKESMTDIETWSIKGVLNEGYFYVKICKKYASEASPRALLILTNSSKQPMHARNSFENKIFWKRIIKKPSKNLLDSFLCTQSLFTGKITKNKRGLGLAKSLSLDCKEIWKIFLGGIYYLRNCDDLI